ncbi:Serine-threonine/tyrosine-protein kinase [Theobroma cacao]|nr:Serine-threonine/tyrosine-protein kinase [Theobroma cacao]
MKVGKFVALVLAVVLFEFLGCRTQASFTPADNYLIVCGSSQNVTFQGRTFVPDSGHSSLSLTSGSSFVASSNSSVPSSIYQSARIFSGIASYKFNIKQEGRHWVRLYFYPLPKSGQNLTSAPITVVTDGFVLLNNFTFKNYNGSFSFKEYAINVTSDTLTLTFISSNNSVSFVNAIEVVSIPDAILPDQALALNPSTPFSGLSEFAMETVYRLSMGGPLITAQNDTLGRTWENDVKYLHVNSSALNVSVNPGSIKYTTSVTPETAPNWVYATAEAMGDANVPSMNFNVTWVFPVDPNFRDFISNSSAESDTLTVSIGPDTVADITNATMNGLEIMKISNDAGSLDGLSSVKNLLPKSSSKKNNIGIIIGCVVGATAAVALIGFCYCCLASRKSKTTHQGHPWLPLPLYGNSQTMTKMSTTSQKSGTASCISLASSNLGRFFSFQEILDATNKFDESLLLGVGGFGRVYKGTLEDGTKVAVKRGNPRSEQGLAEFRTEIEMLSKLRHRHLVSLIGYCDERSEMQLTEKSDVYSFGVVLMEVLCTRPALNPVLPREQVNIAEWAMSWQKKGMLDQIMDSNLVGKVNPASLKKYGETAEKCLAEHGIDRPSMGDVLWNLEYALQLEETSSALMEPDDNSTNHIPAIQLTPLEQFDNSVSMIDGGNSGTDDDAEDAATSAVFSQLVNPRGR